MVTSFALSLSVGLVLVCSLANATQSSSAGVQGWLQVAALRRAISISSRHLGNEMDLAGSEGSEGMKIDNIKPHVSFQPKHFSVGHELHTSTPARSDVDKGCVFVLLASSVPEKVDRAWRWKGPMSLTSLLLRHLPRLPSLFPTGRFKR